MEFKIEDYGKYKEIVESNSTSLYNFIVELDAKFDNPLFKEYLKTNFKAAVANALMKNNIFLNDLYEKE